MDKVFEISGVKPELGHPNDLMRCPDDEAKFFSVYQVFGAESVFVGDFDTRAEAEAWVEKMKNTDDKPVDPNGKQLPPLAVQNLDQFAQLMVDWHGAAQQQIALASNPPANVSIKAIIGGKERTLRQSEREAFIAGVQVAGEIFKDLPFKFVEVELEEAVKGEPDA